MATIKPKRGTGAPTGLVQNELAVNTAGRIIYLGNAGGTGDIVASHTTVRGLSGTVGVSAGSGITITNSGNSFSIALNAGLRELSDTNISLSPTLNDGLVWKGTRWQNTPVVLSLNGGGGDVTAVTSLSAAAGISLSGSTGAVTIQNIGVVSLNGATGTITNVAKTDTAQTFSGLQTFSTGVSAASIFTATVGGDEGGQIDFGNPVTNTSLTGGVAIDIYQNRMRFFEKGGSARGFYIDLTSGAGGVGTNLVASGGGVSTLNNLSGAVVLAAGNNVTITPSGNTLTIAAELSGASAGVTTIRGLSGAVGVSAGSAISITNSGNTFTIANTGVWSFNGSTGNVVYVAPEPPVNSVSAGTGISVINDGGDITVTNIGVVSFGNSTTGGGTYGIRVSGTTGSGIFLTNTGVTQAVAGSGISVSGATGTVTITNQGVRSFSASTNTTDTVQNLLVTPSSGTGDVSLSFDVIAVKTITGSGSGIEVTQASLAEGQGGYAITISNTGVHAINNPKTASGGTYGVRVTGNTGSLEIINTGVTFAQAGSGISVSGATGTVTISNTGLTGIAKSGGAYATGNVTLVEGTDISITQSGSTFTIAYTGVGGPGGGVSTVNGLSGAVGLAVGLGLTLTSSGNTLNIAGLTATTSQIGVASFDSTNFSVSGGVVSITAINGGTF